MSLITIENTNFIFMTNFAGDPARSGKYPSTTRKGNVLIPDITQARELIDAGFNVKTTKPREGEEEGFIPKYFIPVIAKWRKADGDLVKYPPRVYLVSGENPPMLLDEDTVGEIDKIPVDNVNVVLTSWEGPNGMSLYVKTMYVEQGLEDDPFAARYARRNNDYEPREVDPEDTPW